MDSFLHKRSSDPLTFSWLGLRLKMPMPTMGKGKADLKEVDEDRAGAAAAAVHLKFLGLQWGIRLNFSEFLISSRGIFFRPDGTCVVSICLDPDDRPNANFFF